MSFIRFETTVSLVLQYLSMTEEPATPILRILATDKVSGNAFIPIAVSNAIGILSNLSNHPSLLSPGKVELSENIIRVSTGDSCSTRL